jgi:dTDP-4-amino-4,6-dideoxygalactose transaminase
MIENNDDFLDIFERRLGGFTGAPYVVLMDRCTNAIFLSLWYLKNFKDKDVSIIKLPARTYQSVPMTLKNLLGSEIVFTDFFWEKMYNVHHNVIDAAVCFEKNMYKEGSMMCISFQQKKPLNIGKGGAILLDDYQDYLRLQRLVHDGRSRHLTDTIEIKHTPGNILCGFHFNMSPDEGARGILLLNQIENSPRYGKSGGYGDYQDLRKIPNLESQPEV